MVYYPILLKFFSNEITVVNPAVEKAFCNWRGYVSESVRAVPFKMDGWRGCLKQIHSVYLMEGRGQSLTEHSQYKFKFAVQMGRGVTK